MDAQLMTLGAGGAFLLVAVWQIVRSARGETNDSPVSQTWLAERKRMREFEP
jgi:hypothetical protein